jgi:hypothetical protein
MRPWRPRFPVSDDGRIDGAVNGGAPLQHTARGISPTAVPARHSPIQQSAICIVGDFLIGNLPIVDCPIVDCPFADCPFCRLPDYSIADWRLPIANPQSLILNRQSSIVNPQPSMPNRQFAIANPQPSMPNRQFAIANPTNQQLPNRRSNNLQSAVCNRQ